MTVKELALEFKISQQAILKRIDVTPNFRDNYVRRKGKALDVSEDGCNILRNIYNQNNQPTTKNNQPSTTELLAKTIEILQQQLEEKDKLINSLNEQIVRKDEQLLRNNEQLSAAQALNAGTIKLLQNNNQPTTNEQQVDVVKQPKIRRFFKKWK